MGARFERGTPAHCVAEAMYALNRAIGALEDQFAEGATPNVREQRDIDSLRLSRDSVADLLARLDPTFVP